MIATIKLHPSLTPSPSVVHRDLSSQTGIGTIRKGVRK